MPRLRIDRWTTLYLVRPVLGVGPSRASCQIPILMYHGISDEPEHHRSPYYQTNTSPANFQAQMELLRQQRCVGINLEEALPLLRDVKAKDKPYVVITFDDGFRNILTHAFPVMRRLNFSATVFLPTAFIGEQRNAFNGTECLTWDEVKELRGHGIRFGSHTVNHPELYQMSWSQIDDQLRRSK